MVDEAHRTQEGDYGRKMREALPNAFLFGLTGTPINRRDRNTFMWFGSPGGRGRLPVALLDAGLDPRRRDAAAALRAAPVARSTSTRRPSTPPSRSWPRSMTSPRATRSRCRRRPPRSRRSSRRPIAHPPRSPPTSRSTSTRRSSPRGFKAQVVVYDKAYLRRLQGGARQAPRPPRPRRS